MFSVIDKILINLAQWLVRQVELYTSATRKEIFLSFFSLCFLIEIAFITTTTGYVVSVVCTYAYVFYRDLILPIEAIISVTINTSLYVAEYFVWIFSLNFWRHQMTLAKSVPNNEESLPQAILIRKKVRAICMLGFMSSLVILVYFLPTDGSWNVTDFLKIHLPLTCVHGYFACSSAVEYLLCTTTLPPGEKERRKQERELSNMVTQGTSG